MEKKMDTQVLCGELRNCHMSRVFIKLESVLSGVQQKKKLKLQGNGEPISIPPVRFMLEELNRVIKALPKDVKFFITLDVDGLDPSVMPGTVALAPGGLLWWQLIDLLDGISERGPIIGLNVVELSPKNDLNQISMIGVGTLHSCAGNERGAQKVIGVDSISVS
jgi:hypothetical protein